MYLIHGKEKAKSSCGIDFSYAHINIAGVLKGYRFLGKNTNMWHQGVSIWKKVGIIVKVNMAS